MVDSEIAINESKSTVDGIGRLSSILSCFCYRSTTGHLQQDKKKNENGASKTQIQKNGWRGRALEERRNRAKIAII
jgi:hypothetical protein